MKYLSAKDLFSYRLGQILIEETTEILDLEIVDLIEGTGDVVESGTLVTCHYKGTLDDGTEFDSSYSRGEPFKIVVGIGLVINGWDIGLIGMKVGGKRKVSIPFALALGDLELGKIKPHSNLNFEIELIECKSDE